MMLRICFKWHRGDVEPPRFVGDTGRNQIGQCRPLDRSSGTRLVIIRCREAPFQESGRKTPRKKNSAASCPIEILADAGNFHGPMILPPTSKVADLVSNFSCKGLLDIRRYGITRACPRPRRVQPRHGDQLIIFHQGLPGPGQFGSRSRKPPRAGRRPSA